MTVYSDYSPDEQKLLRSSFEAASSTFAEPTMFTQTVFYLLCLGLAALVSLYALRRYRLRQRQQREFRTQAQELGLQEEDMALIQRVARQRSLPLPWRSTRARERGPQCTGCMRPRTATASRSAECCGRATPLHSAP